MPLTITDDFVEPGARRGSVQLGLSRQPSLRVKNKNGAMESNLLLESAYESLVELEAKQKEMEEKHNQVSTKLLRMMASE